MRFSLADMLLNVAGVAIIAAWTTSAFVVIFVLARRKLPQTVKGKLLFAGLLAFVLLGAIVLHA